MASVASPHDSLTASSDLMSLEQVEARIQQLLQENYDLRNTLQQNNTYMRQLSVTLIEWQEEVVRAQNTYRNKFEKAKDVIVKLKEENSLLKQKLVLSSNEDSAEGATALEPSTSAVTEHQEEPDTQDSFVLVGMSDSNKMPEDDAQLPSYDSLYQQTSIKNKEETDLLIKQLQQDSNNLRFQLSVEMESNKNKQIMLNNTQKQLDKLMIEFQELSKKSSEKKLTKLIESPKELETNGIKETNYSQLVERCSELEKQITLLNARLVTAEEIVTVKQAINMDLKSEIIRLEKLVETVPLLQAQLDLYQSDFEAERDARQNLAGEKDAVCQELRLLKRQLEHTIGAPSGSSVRTTVENVTPNAQKKTEVNVYECPKCNFKYATSMHLNNHLDVCLNEQMFP